MLGDVVHLVHSPFVGGGLLNQGIYMLELFSLVIGMLSTAQFSYARCTPEVLLLGGTTIGCTAWVCNVSTLLRGQSFGLHRGALCQIYIVMLGCVLGGAYDGRSAHDVFSAAMLSGASLYQFLGCFPCRWFV